MDLTDLYNKGLLTQDENVAYQTTQRRIKNIIHPISIIVTDKQIIICTPKIGGAKVSTFGYGRVQNIKVRKKFFSSSIEVHTMTDKVDVGGLPKDAGSEILRAIRSIKAPKDSFHLRQ